MTVADGVDSFLRWSAGEAGRSQATMRRYREHFPRFVGFIGDRPLASLTLDDVAGYCEREKAERGASTVMLEMGEIRAFLTFHFDRGRVTVNPRLVKVPRVKARQRVCTCPGDAQGMIDRIGGDGFLARRNRAMLALMADTGMRLSEVTGMMLSDLGADGRTALILGAKKGGERAIGWSMGTARLLAEYLAVRGSVARCDRLFVGDSNAQRGGGITKNVVQKLVEDTRTRPGVTSHSLRRGFATRGVESGVPLTVLMGMMGHKSVCTTQLYAITSDRQVVEARAAIWERERVDKVLDTYNAV